MEAVPGAALAVTGFVLGQLGRLTDEVSKIERMAGDRGGEVAAIGEAVERLRRRMAAHVFVEERLFTSPLRGSARYRDLLTLENTHDALGRRVAEVQSMGCPAGEVAELARVLRAHIEEERQLVRSASAVGADRLAEIASWRADELFECAGGPVPTWPGEWLG